MPSRPPAPGPRPRPPAPGPRPPAPGPRPPAPGPRLSIEPIEEAARTIDPVFLNNPQYADEQLNAALGRKVVV
jgi:hypothetical protein